ncbi:thioesterase [Bowdeniella nasicola]|uniref:Thioesterase n=1 Tax=Bowdeniella nasicola TaxID=208480 RepID=A0A1Q5Q1C4_9ACTO|nr:thioesterase family protein [Bowdeniella nasicola]OKL53502.1 thioesterase [Bowdeniella nasicola]
MTAHAFYRHLGGTRFESTEHAEGAWNPEQQHMAAACGLLAQELERYVADTDGDRLPLRFARLAFDIMGQLHSGEFDVLVETIRPGKTIELIEAAMVKDDRRLLVLRAWRLAVSDSAEMEGYEDLDIPGPTECEPYPEMTKWPGGFIRSTTYRQSARSRPGNGVVWMTTDVDVCEGRETSTFARLMGMADTTNGVMPRGNKDEWMFPNVDLTVYLYREPAGQWIGFDVQQSIGPDGIGVTSTVLHDKSGPFGRAEQILTVRDMRS